MSHDPLLHALPLTDAALYLQRLGHDTAPPPTLDTLRQLQLRHTQVFAFETLATLLHVPVPIDLPALERKLLHEGRGGYCYELNRLYLALLQRLGFAVRPLTGRVVMGGPEDALTARTHLLLLVELDGEAWITDVGFGGMVPTGPLRLATEEAQQTPHEDYRLQRLVDGDYLLRAQVAGAWRAMYRFDLQQPAAIDLEVGNWYVSTHADSPFLGQLVVARTGPGVRHTLHNGSHAVHRLGQASQRQQLRTVDAVLDVLQADFGIRVPEHAALRPTLARLLAQAPA